MDTACSLLLFVHGASASSARAIDHVRSLCEEQLCGRVRLTVVDVNESPELARDRRVLATPTLLRDDVFPERMRVGDFSDHHSVLVALGLATLPAVETERGPDG